MRLRRLGDAVRFLGVRGAALPLTAAAFVWRRLLFRTTVIAITGSVGKTTAKECLAAVLSRRSPTVATIGNRSGRFNIPLTLLRARARHRFVVAEVGIDQPGFMWRSAWVLRPDVAVVLAVKRNHLRAFGSVEKTAAEKAKLLRPLTRRGVAVLNGDDPRTAAMANGGPFQVRMFGRSPEFDVWISGERARWPGRLEFEVHYRGETRLVRTQLVGTHWTPSVLAALTVALSCGLTLDEAIPPLAEAEPFPARMQPVTLPNGAVIVRDEHNGSVESLEPALEVLEEASAERRWLVVSDFSDSGDRLGNRLRYLGQAAARVADKCVFIGEHAARGRARAIQAGMKPEDVSNFTVPRDAARFLQSQLRSGDLVLLRGLVTEHLTRLVFAQFGSVGCWRTDCRKRDLCDDCPDLGFEAAQGASLPEALVGRG